MLDKGEIVEAGNHDELMATKGAYYKLYQAQARHAAEIAGEASMETVSE